LNEDDLKLAARHGARHVARIPPCRTLRAAPAAPQYFSTARTARRCDPHLPNGTEMTDARRDPGPPGWIALVLRDVQFWVPVIVLAAGLLVLRWIS